eukprot:4452287-Alexandrium_andersonii.AAC.1
MCIRDRFPSTERAGSARDPWRANRREAAASATQQAKPPRMRLHVGDNRQAAPGRLSSAVGCLHSGRQLRDPEAKLTRNQGDNYKPETRSPRPEGAVVEPLGAPRHLRPRALAFQLGHQSAFHAIVWEWARSCAPTAS